ncbi:TPA: hypothetical protein LTW52_005161 [Escherichia coli]|nr:hypothetical protein [Escherichia coli]
MIFKKQHYILLISLLWGEANAETYYGTLRGEGVTQYKSPFNGIIELGSIQPGGIYSNSTLFVIRNHEYLSKMEILELKINMLKENRNRLYENLWHSKNALKKGFISRNDFFEKNYEIENVDINIKELSAELEGIKSLNKLGIIHTPGKLIINDIAVNDHQYVNTGDYIMQVERLNSYYVDIKFDPVAIKGRLQDKNITFKSLVSKVTGKGIVSKVANSQDKSSEVYGLKIASIKIECDDDYEISSLLDTVFEIIVND